MSSEDTRIVRFQFEKGTEGEWIRLSNNFVDNFLFENGRMIDIPITALRIIANVVSIIRDSQFQPENRPRQLSLFEEDFETENNVFAQFKIKNSRISPSRSQKQVIDAYEFLSKYKMGWYSSVNSQGKTIKTFGGLITAASYDQRGYTSFLISSYWLKKLIVIPEYNRVLFNLVYNIKNNKYVVFAIWLNRIPNEGTIVNLQTLNNRFGLNYSNAGDFCSKFLRPLRLILDRVNDLSFNYSFKMDKITILPYRKEVKFKNLSMETKITTKSAYRLNYFRKRFKLSNDAFQKLKEAYEHSSVLIEEAYHEFVNDKRKAKVPSTLFSGRAFLQELQFFVVKQYRESKCGEIYPDAYPRIL